MFRLSRLYLRVIKEVITNALESPHRICPSLLLVPLSHRRAANDAFIAVDATCDHCVHRWFVLELTTFRKRTRAPTKPQLCLPLVHCRQLPCVAPCDASAANEPHSAASSKNRRHFVRLIGDDRIIPIYFF